MTVRRLVVLALATGLMAGCVSDPTDNIACPALRVLNDLDELTRFSPGPGRDPTDVQLEAWISRVTGKCELDERDLLVDIVIQLGTRRGPANTSKEAEIRYFVAIADLQQNVLNRRTFLAKAPYVSRKTISFQDTLTLNIPVDRGQEGDGFTVYVGLELSESELRHNRSRARR